MLRAACLLALVATALAVPTYRSFDYERVVNGTDAPAGKYPSQVSYQRNDRHRCGGSILNEYWILTAGHCVYGDDVSTIKILSGTVDLYAGDGTMHQAVEMVLHEGYNHDTKLNDIALVRVDTPFVWDAMTMPVVLAAQGQETPAGSDATLIGWGYPYTGGTYMQFLQEVDYFIVSDQECSDVHNLEVFPTNICAYYPGGGKGQCSGDSGGPLWVAGEQVGFASWSEKPCTIAPYPGVFTEVSHYIGWIDSKINV